MDKFKVSLYSRGDCLRHAKIKICYDVHARDDVDAAMSAKQKATLQFPDRGTMTWFADKVEKKESDK